LTLEEGPGGWWLGAKVNGKWQIVATGSDVVSCKLIDQYNFPSMMVTECADDQTGEVRKRVTMDDFDKILAEVGQNLNLKLATPEDTLLDWQDYGGNVTNLNGRGVSVVPQSGNWDDLGKKINDFYYMDKQNSDDFRYGFFVRDIVVCELDNAAAGRVYLSCGAM
jgi:hypothetical protein